MQNYNYPTFALGNLIASPIKKDNFSELYSMHQNPEVMQTLGGIRGVNQTKQILNKLCDHWVKYDFGVWHFKDKKTEDFVGRAGIQHCIVDSKQEIEILYALMPEYWNKGIATFIVKKLIKISKDMLKIDNLVCFTMIENKASKNVMKKAGFQYEKNIIHAGLPHVLYRLCNK